MITVDDYFMRPDRRIICATEFKPEFEVAAQTLLDRVNQLLRYYDRPVSVRSGWRPPSINACTAGASLTSHHMTGKAVDIADPHQELAHWCLENLSVLERQQLWMEDHHSTPTWCHLQSVPPRSGNRVFRP